MLILYCNVKYHVIYSHKTKLNTTKGIKMRETNTQKNWNEYFDNPRRPSSNIRWGLVIFMVFCVGCAVVYSIADKDNNTNNSVDYAYYYEDDFLNQVDDTKTGEVMADSVETIEDIFESIEDKTMVELNESINTVRELELSYEYEEFRQLVIRKISYYIDYKLGNKPEDLEGYNKINWVEELAAVFDMVGVEYEISISEEKTEIEFVYHK